MKKYSWEIQKGCMPTNKKLRSVHMDYQRDARHRIMGNVYVQITQTERNDMTSEVTDELKDLKKIYEERLESLNRILETNGPFYLSYMEQYVKLHKEIAEVKDKLDNLLEKMGDCDECDDGDDDNG